MSKIKSIIFDLDGVLVDTKKIHFTALNKAFSDCKIKYQISLQDHLKIYDGLPTTEKLRILKVRKLNYAFTNRCIIKKCRSNFSILKVINGC